MWKTYLIFGVFNTVFFIHVFFIFPETAGKTLEETEAMFEDPQGIKYLGTPAWKTRVKTKEILRLEHGDIESKQVRAPAASMSRDANAETQQTAPAGTTAESSKAEGHHVEKTGV